MFVVCTSMETSEFIHVDNVAIHYCVERNFHETTSSKQSLPWLILLHGFGGGLFSWKRCIPLLLQQLQQDIAGVLAFDRVGFGLTERPITCTETQDTSEQIDSDRHRDFTLKVIRTLVGKFSMDKCILVGHSTGGLVANWFAFHHPQLVHAVILVSPTTGMPAFIRSILKTKLGTF